MAVPCTATFFMIISPSKSTIAREQNDRLSGCLITRSIIQAHDTERRRPIFWHKVAIS